MRLYNRYKSFTKPNTFIIDFPERIGRFKRAKWKILQNKLLKLSKKKIRRETSVLLKPVLHTWEKNKQAYKTGLLFKTALMATFDHSINRPFLKKSLLKCKNQATKDLLTHSIVKPYFRIDILLTSLEFFKTAFQARQFINEGNILINFKRVKSNIFLKQGDIISFDKDYFKSFSSLKLFPSLTIKFNKFYSFIEYDYYTNTIIVVKNIDDLTFDDLSLLLPQSYDINILRNYV